MRGELSQISLLDALEIEHLANVHSWIDSGSPLCRTAKLATPPKHLVSYFVVISNAQLLLVDHRDAGLWLPTGGHVEYGEDPRETVCRECQEELGFRPARPGPPLLLTVTETVGQSSGHIDVSLWYVVQAGDQCIDPCAEEFTTVAWFDYMADTLPYNRCDPHLARFASKIRHAYA